MLSHTITRHARHCPFREALRQLSPHGLQTLWALAAVMAATGGRGVGVGGTSSIGGDHVPRLVGLSQIPVGLSQLPGAAPSNKNAGRWSEVAPCVQGADGAVRTSGGAFARASSGAGAIGVNGAVAQYLSEPRSPQPMRSFSPGRGGAKSSPSRKLMPSGRPRSKSNGRATSSRGGSWRGGSSRSSSREPPTSQPSAREADVSCEASSTGSTLSSRPETPPADVPREAANAVKDMAIQVPAPVFRTLRPCFLEHDSSMGSASTALRSDVVADSAVVSDTVLGDTPTLALSLRRASEADNGEVALSVQTSFNRPPAPPPPRRDGFSRGSHIKKGKWTIKPLYKYLESVINYINDQQNKKKSPGTEEWDKLVEKLVDNTQKLLKNAPNKERAHLQSQFSQRFQAFWNFESNVKVKTNTPEDLKGVLLDMVDTFQDLGLAPAINPAIFR